MPEKPPFFDYYGNSLPVPCKDAEPELFFPNSNELLIEEAKSYCRRCKIVQKCLEYALNTNQQGVWGCTTDDERKAIKAAQKDAATKLTVTQS
jgi:WhiB family redox-sensing transcriptional regulator